MQLLSVLDRIVTAASKLPRNSALWAYTINSAANGNPYLTRLLTPRIAGWRLMFHRIHQPDHDPFLHNHPWGEAIAIVLHGGYVEERLCEDGVVRERGIRAGDQNVLRAGDFHRITTLAPDTWTLFVAGPRVQDWGFRLADGSVLPHAAYYQQLQARPS